MPVGIVGESIRIGKDLQKDIDINLYKKYNFTQILVEK